MGQRNNWEPFQVVTGNIVGNLEKNWFFHAQLVTTGSYSRTNLAIIRHIKINHNKCYICHCFICYKVLQQQSKIPHINTGHPVNVIMPCTGSGNNYSTHFLWQTCKIPSCNCFPALCTVSSVEGQLWKTQTAVAMEVLYPCPQGNTGTSESTLEVRSHYGINTPILWSVLGVYKGY